MGRDSSPTGSVRSAVSTRSVVSSASEHGARRIPPALLAKSKEELVLHVVDLLKKLKIREKKMEDLSAALSAQGQQGQGDGGSSVSELKAALEAVTKRAEAAEKELKKVRAEVQELVHASKSGALASETLVDGLQKDLQEARSALESAGEGAHDLREREGMLQQQMASLKDALKEMSQEREDAFGMLGESKESLLDAKDDLAQLRQELADSRSATTEAASATTQAQAKIQGLEQGLSDATSALALAEGRAGAARLEADRLQKEVDALQSTVGMHERSETPASGDAELAACRACIAALESELAASAAKGATEVDELAARLAASEATIVELEARLSHSAADVVTAGAANLAAAMTSGAASLAASWQKPASLAAEVVGPSPGPGTPHQPVLELAVSQLLTAELAASDGHMGELVSVLESAKSQLAALRQDMHAEGVLKQRVVELEVECERMSALSFSPVQATVAGDEGGEVAAALRQRVEELEVECERLSTVQGQEGGGSGNDAAALRQRVVELEAECERLSELNVPPTHVAVAGDADVGALKQRVEELEAECGRLVDLNDQTGVELAARLTQVVEKEREAQAMHSALQEAEARLEEMEERVRGMVEEMETEGGDSSRLASERDSLSARVEELDAELAARCAELAALSSQMEDAVTNVVSALAAKEAAEKVVTELSDVNETLESRLASLQDELAAEVAKSEAATRVQGGQDETAVAASSRIDELAAENVQLQKEVADTKKKMLMLVKKKTTEHATHIKELEARISDLATRAAESDMYRVQLGSSKAQLADLEAVRSERADLASSLAARCKELEQAHSLMSDYKSMAASKEGAASSALAKLEAELKKAQVESEKAIARVESRLHARELEGEGLTVQLAKTERRLEEAQRAQASQLSGNTAELAAARGEAEAAKTELQAVKKETEAEKSKLSRALDEAKKRMAKAEKSKHAAELAAAEATGKLQVDMQGGKIEVALAQQALEMARRDTDRVETELKDYRTRAQALLKSKENEIREIRDSTAALTSSCISAEEAAALKLQLEQSQQACRSAENQLADLEERSAAEMSEMSERQKSELSSLQGRVTHFQNLAGDLQKELEEWKHKCEALEARVQHQKCTAGAVADTATQRVADLERSLDVLSAELAREREEGANFQNTSEMMMEAKDAEVLSAVRRNALLHEDLMAARQQLQSMMTSAALAAASAASPMVVSAKAPPSPTPPAGEEDSLAEAPLTPRGSGPLGGLSKSTLLDDSDTFWRSSQHHVSHAEFLEGLIKSDAADLASIKIQPYSEEAGPPSEGREFGETEGAASANPADEGESDYVGREGMYNGTNRQSVAGSAALASQPSQGGTDLAALWGAMAAEGGDAALVQQLRHLSLRNRQLEAELAEFEKEVALREEMEAALKESLREADRELKRQIKATNLVDVEYLKNTVLKLYRSCEAEILLPVFATILSFSPEELKMCKDGLRAIKAGEVPLPGAAAAVDGVFSSFGSWTSWATGGSTAPG